MDLDRYYDKIEAYLNNTLSDKERVDFEAEINTNPALKKAVLNHVLANEAMGLTIEDRIANKLQKLEQKREATPPLKVWWKQPLAIAASILFLIVASLVIWVNQNYSNQALAKEVYAQSTLPTVRGDIAEHPNFSDGLVTFTNQEYASSIEHLTKISINDPTYIPAQYLLGHAYFKTNTFQKAVIAFNTVLAAQNLPQTIDLQEVEWNKLLAEMSLQSPKNNQFLTDLNTILANPQHAYYQDAVQLKQQIDSPWRNFTW